MKRHSMVMLALALALGALLPVGANAADYSFSGVKAPDYYAATSYEDVYGARYNYGGANLVDYQFPTPEYGVLSTTQTGVMEKTMLPNLLQSVAGTANGGYGVSIEAQTAVSPSAAPSTEAHTAPPTKTAFTRLTESFKLANGAIGKISIPSIGVKNYYLWEGETSNSMSKGLGHFTGTSVWDGNCGVCGHNRGATYSIGAIKDLKLGNTVTYTTSAGTRTYAVTTVAKIGSDDWSYLGATTDNRITLITCVAGDSSQRWVVQAVQK